MTGYSGTPLAQKLGIKEGMTVGLTASPPDFVEKLASLPTDVELHEKPIPSDIIIVFATQEKEIRDRFRLAMGLIPSDGAIWVAWPKKSSGLDSELDENMMRDLFLPTGMVDNKVCAIDEIWSGLRFVVRKENRADWPDPII